jgi:hypothetical protein
VVTAKQRNENGIKEPKKRNASFIRRCWEDESQFVVISERRKQNSFTISVISF